MIRVDGNGGTSSLVKVRGLNKTYSRGGEKIQVLQGLNLDVDKGDFVAFMGPSGSGKTTLLNLLGGLDVPSAGSITVDGDEITHMSGSKLTHWRARRRFYFSDVQPHPRAHGIPECRASAAVDQALEVGTPQARGDSAQRGRSCGPHEPLSPATVGREGAARHDRSRHRLRPYVPSLRRAHRRPGP